MLRVSRKVFRWTMSAALLFACAQAAFAAPARVAVNKKRLTVGNPPVLVLPPVTSGAIAGSGFVRVADYGSRSVYEGPVANVDSFLTGVRSDGYTAALVTELDQVRLHGYAIDAETGSAAPTLDPTDAPPGPNGVFLLTLRSYPLQSWLDDLATRQVRILQEIPPGAYLIRCARAAVPALRQAQYVRGVFPVPPALKRVGFETPPPDGSAYRRFIVRAVVETPPASLRPLLQTFARNGFVHEAVTEKIGLYEAHLTDLDARTVSFLGDVYEVAVAGHPRPSSERQAQLVAQTGTQATLPTLNSPDYSSFLISKGFESSANTFDNTKVGIIDTGFDNGQISYAQIHPDFKFQIGMDQIAVVVGQRTLWAFPEDRDHHGTLVTSIIAGYPAASAGRADSGGYRYGLGLAPTVRCVYDKLFNCNVPPESWSLDDEVRILVDSFGVNVINMSFNDPSGIGCGYGVNSQIIDGRTRSRNVLSVVAAGNSPEACAEGNYVRPPATSKNGIAVGATESFSLFAENPRTDNTCLWNGFPLTQDARHIPTYSAIGRPGSIYKPDLVAPGTRITGPLARGASGCASALCNDNVALFGDIQYGNSAGTSFAAPAVTGAAAVVRKWYKNKFGGDPSPAMTKSILINGARDIAAASPTPPCSGPAVRNAAFAEVACIGHIPDPYQGWGMLSFERLLGSPGTYFFYDQGVSLLPSSGLWQKFLYIVDGSRDTHVTLVWTDAPGAVGPPSQPYVVTNDLDLSLTNASGTSTWYGNRLSNGYSILNPPYSPDTINNVEQIIIPAGALPTGAGVIVAVDPRNVMATGQDFGLVLDNATEPATSLNTLTPCRLVDTRNPPGPFGGPALDAGVSRTFPVVQNCGVPISAKSVVVNVTITAPSADGTLRLYPGGVVPPLSGVLYYSAGQTRANNSIVALGADGVIGARADQASGTTHVLIDVTGYFQ